MRNFIFLIALTFLISVCNAQKDEIRLLVRGDDIGSFHAANLACIHSYKNGIMRSVEVMVPCPWFPEAVSMLNENPGLDVGIHLVMTSEWTNMKWRPIIGKSSLTDEEGYFLPMVWPNEHFPPEKAFKESDYSLKDVELELRAQIELAQAKIKNVSHISNHMGFTSADSEINELVKKLAIEYGLYIDMNGIDLNYLRFENDKTKTKEERAQSMANAILDLKPGTYLFVDHPGMDTPEMENIGHKGYTDVGKDREGVTYMFTSEIVKKAIEKKGVQLISYQDL